MSQTVLSDPELGGEPGGPDDRSNQNTTTSNQPLKGESNFGDSSGALFNIYSKAAEEEDNKMVERWQKDADGILFFTGLFSASVAALLAVTVQDLRPNSQDTSAFYLGNIYQVLADPNVTRTSIPSPDPKPPPFSPSRYAVWVNTLWFLSLVMSLSCALWATSLQQWARRYLRLAQPSRCHPEKRARMRAFFADGVDKMHIPWAVEGLPTLLHLSLFLFFAGLAVFLFNVDREVFNYVIWWIGFFFLVYGMITLLPLIWQDSPYNSPLSTPVWFLYTAVPYVTIRIIYFKFYTIISSHSFFVWLLSSLFCRDRFADFMNSVFIRLKDSQKYYRRRMLGGVGMLVEEAASKRSPEIDLQILDWTISTLGDDDSLKSFFEAIPGFFDSKLVNLHEKEFSRELVNKFEAALCGFVRHTCTSNSVEDSEKLRRLDMCLDATKRIMRNKPDHFVLGIILDRLQEDEGPLTVDMGHVLARWLINHGECTHAPAQTIFAGILVSVRERNDSWVTLAARAFGLPERDLWDNIALKGDSVLLFILIQVTRRYLRSDYKWRVTRALSKLDICNTHPRLQRDFCTLWNDIVLEARKKGHRSIPTLILKEIRHLYFALHQGTNAAPAAFPASPNWDVRQFLQELRELRELREPSLHPFCTLASHRQHSTPGNPFDALSPSSIDGGNTFLPQAEHSNGVEPETSEIGATTHGHDITPPINPAHSSSRLSSTAVVAHVLQDITSIATSSYPLENSDIVAPTAGPGTSQISSTAYTHAPTSSLALIPTSLPNTLSDSYDAGAASVSNPLHFALPSIDSSNPASRPTGSAKLPCPRPRGLVNTRNICFANAVLQLLVHSPPFWNRFRELGDLKERRGADVPDTNGDATPLVDATARLFKEFSVEESQPVTGRKSRTDGEKRDKNNVDSFEPTYIYDAMKEKRQLKPLLDGQQQDAEEFLCLYLDALDEELRTLLASIRGQFARAALGVGGRDSEVSQSCQDEVGSQGSAADFNFLESPTMQIFTGKFRLPVRALNQPDVFATEDWRSLHLDIQHDSIRTVQGALAHITQPKSVQVGASGLGNDTSQQVLIEALPPVLVLHINRVRYDASESGGGITKIGKSIQLAPEIEIPLDIMVPDAQRPSEPPHYRLHGVLYHHGESAGGGHYTVDVLHSSGVGDTGEVWLHIDDETVNVVGHEDVFGDGTTEQAVDEGCAYLLFYCRLPQ